MDPYAPPCFDPLDPELPDRFEELSLWAARFGTLLLDEVPLPSRGPWLDLGCGTGFPLVELSQMLGPGRRAVGVDTWGPALARARHKAQLHGLPALHVVRGDGGSLPFPDSTFTLVVSNVGVNNFPDPALAIREAARVLAPGGALALATNPLGHMALVYAAMRESLAATGHADRIPRLDAQERHRPSRDDVARLLTEAGLVAPRLVERPMRLRYASGAAMLRHGLTRWGFLGGWRGAIGEDAAPEVLADLERRLDAVAASEGELAVDVPQLYAEARKPRA